MDKQGKFH